MKHYVLYATSEHGEGHIQTIGRFDDLSDISIRIGTFAKDVVLTIDEEGEE